MYHVWSLCFHTGGSQGIMPNGALGHFYLKSYCGAEKSRNTYTNINNISMVKKIKIFTIEFPAYVD